MRFFLALALACGPLMAQFRWERSGADATGRHAPAGGRGGGAVTSGQLSAIVPYGISGKRAVPVALEANGLEGPSVQMAVAESAPAIFIYVTGECMLQPVSRDGWAVSETLPRPVLPVRVLMAGREAAVLYAGGAPGLIAGVMQVNARVPEGVPGEAIAVTVQVGGAESPAGVSLRYFP